MKKILVTKDLECMNLKLFMKKNFQITHNTLNKLIRTKKLEVMSMIPTQDNIVNDSSNLNKDNKSSTKAKLSTNYLLKLDDIIIIRDPLLIDQSQNIKEITPNNTYLKLKDELYNIFKFNIIYENNNVIIINKPPGLSCQGGPKIKFSIDKIAKDYINNNEDCDSNIKDCFLLHRIDKLVNGLLLIGKDRKSSSLISNCIKNEKERMQKNYCTTAQGIPNFILKLIQNIKESKNTRREMNRSSLYQYLINCFQFPIYVLSNEDCSCFLIITQDFTYSSETSQITPFGIDYYIKHHNNIPSLTSYLSNLEVSGSFLLKSLLINSKFTFNKDNIEKLLELDLSNQLNYHSHSNNDYCFIDYSLYSGKKHQIRKHLSKCLLTPIIGDQAYLYIPSNSSLVESIITDRALQNNFYDYLLQSNIDASTLIKYGIYDFQKMIFLTSKQIKIDKKLLNADLNSNYSETTYDNAPTIFANKKFSDTISNIEDESMLTFDINRLLPPIDTLNKLANI